MKAKSLKLKLVVAIVAAVCAQFACAAPQPEATPDGAERTVRRAVIPEDELTVTQTEETTEVTEKDIPAITEVKAKPALKHQDVDRAIQKARKRTGGRAMLKINNNTKIAMTPGQNELIPIARYHTNRIVTPFRNPEVVSTSLTGGNAKDGNCGEVCVKGNAIYVSTNRTEPASMFITEQGSEERALSVTMIPRDVPPREVFLEIVAGAGTTNSVASAESLREAAEEAEMFEKSLPYVETIRTMMRDTALGKIPPGYTMGVVRGARNIPRCKQAGLKFDFINGQRLTGHNLDIYVGVAQNVSKKTLAFNEQSCGNWGAAAVAAWPLHVLNPGQKTEVYVVMKEASKIFDTPERPFLIRPQFNNAKPQKG